MKKEYINKLVKKKLLGIYILLKNVVYHPILRQYTTVTYQEHGNNVFTGNCK